MTRNSPQPIEKKAYTVNEVAELTGLSRSTIYAQIRVGKLIAQYPHGIRTARFSDREVDRWIKSWPAEPPKKDA